MQAFEVTATAVGLNAAEQMARVDLPISSLHKPDLFIAYRSFVRLLQNSAADSNRPDFGLLMAKNQTPHIEGPLTVLMRHADSLEHALKLISQYGYVFSPEIRFLLLQDTQRARQVDMTLVVRANPQQSCVQAIEYFLLLCLGIGRFINGPAVQPLRLCIPHERQGPQAHYARYVDCDLIFNCKFASITFSAEDLVKPLPGRNPLLLQMASSYIDRKFGDGNKLTTDRVRFALSRLMADGKTNLTDIAAEMSLHAKTLQRRLAQEGQRYDALLEAARRDRFLELISQSSKLSLGQIAQALGYSEQAALTRSCWRWFGCSPITLRNGVATVT